MPTPEEFLLENGGELEQAWFGNMNLTTLAVVWIDFARNALGLEIDDTPTAEQLAIIRAYVYARAYRALVYRLKSQATSVSAGGVSVSRDPKGYQWFLELYNPWARLTNGLLEPIHEGVPGGAVLTEVVSNDTYR